MKQLPYRQIHLDFHTSPLIPDVGEEFDAAEFVATLREARVNSINLFARCHHGFSYYPTRVGVMHPALKTDLFGAQLKAVREAGMRALAYTTVAWSEDTCDRHPEWMQVSPDGVLGSKPPFKDGFGNLECRAWRSLCLNRAAYRDYLKRETAEIYEGYHPDGIWIDIIHQYECVCPDCRRGMAERGLDPTSRADRIRYGRWVELDFMEELYRHIHGLDEGLEVYFNASPAAFDLGDDRALTNNNKRRFMDFVDIESLPSEEWGYLHFPVQAAYMGKYDQPFAMMNGKFHKSWGDFGSLRNRAALEYECLRAVAHGARVCVGDQLHPRGRLDPVVYRRIGEVFAKIEALEPWCEGTERVAQIGVLAPNRSLENELREATHSAGLCAEGVYRVLSELKLPFDFLVEGDPVEGYELLILPDQVRLTPAMTALLEAYLAKGGKLLCTGYGGLAADSDAFPLAGFPARYMEESPYDNPYVRVEAGHFPGIEPMDYVLGRPGPRALPQNGADVLAWYVDPYFNRSYEHTCSHRQTPPDRLSEYGAVFRAGGIIYVSPPLFTDYAAGSAQVHKQLLEACIDRLLGRRLVEGNLPSTAEVTVRRRGADRMVHILSYIPHRRCRSLDTIEDIIPLHDVELRLALDREPRSVTLALGGEALSFRWEDGVLHFGVPRVNGHCLVFIAGA